MGTRRVVKNVVWNWAGMATQMAVGFVTAPLLIRHLGDAGYGLWILIASLTSYFGALDLGMRGSVGRNIAYCRARGDVVGVNATFNTAFGLLGSAGLVAILGTFGVATVFLSFFPDVPPERVEEARLAILLVGLNVALTLTASVFDATLWAFQRFDLINAVDACAAFTRLGLTFYFIGNGGGLVALALIALVSNAADCVKGIAVFRLDRQLSLSPRLACRGTVGVLLNYGVWNFAMSISRLITNQSAPVIIGRMLGVGLVTPYSASARLLHYAQNLVNAAGEALTPVATTFCAQDKHTQQRSLFVHGGKYCLSLALLFLTWFIFLGRPFLELWISPAMGHAAVYLMILALGETLPMSQIVTRSVVLGRGEPRPLALINLTENAVAVVLAVVLARIDGLRGVAIAFAIPALVCRGLGHAWYACRALGVSFPRYVAEAWAPALAGAVIPAAALAAALRWRWPSSWWEMIAFTATYATLFIAVNALALMGPERLLVLARSLWPGARADDQLGIELIRGRLANRQRGAGDEAA